MHIDVSSDDESDSEADSISHVVKEQSNNAGATVAQPSSSHLSSEQAMTGPHDRTVLSEQVPPVAVADMRVPSSIIGRESGVVVVPGSQPGDRSGDRSRHQSAPVAGVTRVSAPTTEMRRQSVSATNGHHRHTRD